MTARILLALIVLARTAGAGEWVIPSPESKSHPQAAAAPSADPRTYPDPKGFAARSDFVIHEVAGSDITVYRRGYFAGGDPGKYVPGIAMAQLLLDPQAPLARQLMNDARSPGEHYHFAAVNWARFVPVFGAALTPETKKTLSENAARFAYLDQTGTENHRSMSLTSANVLPSFLDGDRFSQTGDAQALARAKEKLRAYIKGLFHAGMGEWDSNIYHLFLINGLLNVYDFAEDEETRLIAAAGLDWCVAAYALKFRDGVYGGPNQRGYARGPVEKLTDQHGWLWWGSDRNLQPGDAGKFLHTLHPITSAWRPNRVLCHLAAKDLPGLPCGLENSKANYWFGREETPRPGEYKETLWLGRTFSMGTLWNGFGSQITRFQIVVDGPAGGIVATAGSPRKSDHNRRILDELTFEDGGGRTDQWVQSEGTAICLTRMPENETADFLYFTVPSGVASPERQGPWWIFPVADTTIGVRALTGDGVLDREAAAGKDGRGPAIVRFAGRQNALLIEAADTPTAADRNAFRVALAATTVEETSPFGLRYRDRSGRQLEVTWSEHGERARLQVNGREQEFRPGTIYSGPFVRQTDGVLEVSDGRNGYRIDFRGDLPVYQELSATELSVLTQTP